MITFKVFKYLKESLGSFFLSKGNKFVMSMSAVLAPLALNEFKKARKARLD